MFAAACAVFPDQAIVPARESGEAGSRDEPATMGAGTMGGAANSAAPAHGGDSDGVMASGGAAVVPEPSGGGAAGVEALGSNGGGGEPAGGCVNRQVLNLAAEADTWIDADKPNGRHGGDEQLLVVSGAMERRALLALPLPAAPPATRLQRADFIVRLEANGASSERVLAVHRLTRAFNETRASWRFYDNGSQWDASGGDFGPELASAHIPGGTNTGAVMFDVTAAIGSAVESGSSSFWLIVREASTATAETPALAFTARDDVAGAPLLRLVYCDP